MGAVLLLVLVGVAYSARSSDQEVVDAAAPASPSDESTSARSEPSVSFGPETVSDNTTNPPQADLHDDLTCEVDQIGWVVAKGTLTNHSSQTSAYMLLVSFNDADGVRFAEGSAFHNDVRSGESVRWDTFPAARAPAGEWTCEIVSIERFASQ